MKLRIFILVLLLGAAGFLLFSNQYHSQSPQSAQNNTPQPIQVEKTFKVWMTTQEISRGEEVTREQLKIVSLKQAQAFEHAIDHDVEITVTPGMVINRDLKQGEFIFPEMLVTPEQDEYVNLIIQPNHIPYPIALSPEVLVGGGIQANSFVDVLAYTASNNSHIADDAEDVEYLDESDTRDVSISPLLMHVKVLKVSYPHKSDEEDSGEDEADLLTQKATLVLELTQKQVAKMTVARHISDIAVQHSIGTEHSSDLSADVDDVLPNLNQVREMRGDQDK
ncbi:Flp pilus assembly protein CpaB [Vibrio neonatus]|uniref:Flp pilus assembly protein CpaB n=1 Tax=Vibrio neonatus TaxID=278860 RepID=UPI0021C47FCA|nr:Flp pilus assembly protein CpaB [Vibrio neonatus]